MESVFIVNLQSAANTGVIDVKNRSVSIYAPVTAPLTFNATVSMNGGVFRVFAEKLRVDAGLSVYNNHQFLLTGSGVLSFWRV